MCEHDWIMLGNILIFMFKIIYEFLQAKQRELSRSQNILRFFPICPVKHLSKKKIFYKSTYLLFAHDLLFFCRNLFTRSLIVAVFWFFMVHIFKNEQNKKI